MDTIKNMSERMDGKSSVEGATTRKVEKVTAAVPSIMWLMLAGGSIVGSLALKLGGRNAGANFVGQWAPTFLLLGIYNKLVKVMGSDRQESKSY